ncbi:hypothetical protein [Halosimplex amylolyticum]|uniref:hypothetical protein n=1 Tax=Halosimplex amylolyticum TaxID=3396616 RepID=UPI003F54F872
MSDESNGGEDLVIIAQEEISERYDWWDYWAASYRRPSSLFRLILGIIFAIISANVASVILSIQSILFANPLWLLTVILTVSLLLNWLFLSQLSSGAETVEEDVRADKEEEEKRSEKKESKQHQTEIAAAEPHESSESQQLSLSNVPLWAEIQRLQTRQEELEEEVSEKTRREAELESEIESLNERIQDLENEVDKNRDFVARTYEIANSDNNRSEQSTEKDTSGEDTSGHDNNTQNSSSEEKEPEYEK